MGRSQQVTSRMRARTSSHQEGGKRYFETHIYCLSVKRWQTTNESCKSGECHDINSRSWRGSLAARRDRQPDGRFRQDASPLTFVLLHSLAALSLSYAVFHTNVRQSQKFWKETFLLTQHAQQTRVGMRQPATSAECCWLSGSAD